MPSLLLSIAFAAPIHTTSGSLFGHDAVAIGADGTTYALVTTRQSRLGRITATITTTDSDGIVKDHSKPRARLLVAAPGAEVVEEPIPSPDGSWDGTDRVKDGALALDGSGRPVVVLLGENCPEKTPCSPRLWVSTRTESGWDTDRWSLEGSSYRDVLIDTASGQPYVVLHRSLPDSVVVMHDGRSETTWFANPKAHPQAVLHPKGELALLYRSGKELRLRAADADELLSGSVSHRAAGTVAKDGIYFHHYSAKDKRLHGGKRGEDPSSIDTPESGWHNAMTTHTDGAPLGAWYQYRNNWNKGVAMGHLVDGKWETWSAIRSDTSNIGWGVDIASTSSGVALVAADRSDRSVHLYTWPSLEAAKAEAIPSAGDWTDRRRTAFFFVYGGGWFQGWSISTAAPSTETFEYGELQPLTGSYGITPGISAEGGIAGKIGPVDIVMEIMRRSENDEAFQTINKLQNFMGKIGIDDIPLPDSEMQLHVRVSDLKAAYEDADGEIRAYDNFERQVELRYVGKAGYHLGLRYHGFRGPQDVYVSQNQILTDAFVADATFTEGSFIAGWSVLDYLKKYEVKFFGPYMDAQIGAGFAQVDLGGQRAASAFTFPAGADIGIAAYKRSKALYGLGGFARVGLRGTAQYTGSAEPDDSEGTSPYYNFTRLDLRYGPYANVGLVF